VGLTSTDHDHFAPHSINSLLDIRLRAEVRDHIGSGYHNPDGGPAIYWRGFVVYKSAGEVSKPQYIVKRVAGHGILEHEHRRTVERAGPARWPQIPSFSEFLCR
jgi:hypothetical protein